jgi:hypothetical protein
MTDATLISRAEFIERYRTKFDELYEFNVNDECVIREHANWEVMEFPDMNLSGWSSDIEIFQCFLYFISVVVTPVWFVLAEVESIEKFTEAWIVPADRLKIEALWIQSRLPHFNTVCFDDSTRWCALFDNILNKVVVCRAMP